MRIILDLDEVLVDFLSPACIVHGTTKTQLIESGIWQPGISGLHKVLGISLDAFWQKLNAAGNEFWEDLEPQPWADELLELVIDKSGGDWLIASTPGYSSDCYIGKTDWLKNFFGYKFNRFAVFPYKEMLANKKTVLIDDQEDNILKFSKEGGRSILFPTLGNVLHRYRLNPMPFVKERLDALEIQKC